MIEKCYDCGEPNVAIVVDAEEPETGFSESRPFCATCAVARGLLTISETEPTHD